MKPEEMFSPAVEAFFEKLIHREQAVRRMEKFAASLQPDLDVDELVHFFRVLKSQEIFIQTIGLNGKLVPDVLSNIIYNFNDEVRLYYSQSLDLAEAGYIKICPDYADGLVVVENIYGDPLSRHRLYQSTDQKAVLKYMIRWLLKRIDWDKTRLNNMDLYKIFIERKQAEAEAEMARIQAEIASHKAEILGQKSK
ncbi:hypothetical protein [Thiomicrospira sp. ALE5]|uniref:hypothetical protein n=1 Tax=Thiomicrospira sp. ALE5 TaxID=748650 RepID=UPI0008ED3303|nr:hypothetical protein [Thiomicrospira sp. ALE5]SFR62639.1 hypothetical protein SAMN03092900_1826 [Thiomicrospira sp. ALE5]